MLTLPRDGCGKSALRCALEANPPMNMAVKTILHLISAHFHTPFGYYFVALGAFESLRDDILFAFDHVPACVDYFVRFLFDYGLVKVPRGYEVGRVRMRPEVVLTEGCGENQFKARPFAKYLDVPEDDSDSAQVNYLTIREPVINKGTSPIEVDVWCLSVAGMPQSAQNLMFKGCCCVSRQDNSVAKLAMRNSMPGNLQYKLFSASALTAVIDFEWKTFGKKYSITELIVYITTFAARARPYWVIKRVLHVFAVVLHRSICSLSF